LIKIHGLAEAEFAIIVADAWHNTGLGTGLMKALLDVGRQEKLRRITGCILPENAAMLGLARKAGFDLQFDPHNGEWQAVLVPR
jgi:acetyltransferase